MWWLRTQGSNGPPLWYKGLEIERNLALRAHFGNYGAAMTLSRAGIDDIQWWVDNIQLSSKQKRDSEPDLVTESDASMLGWGASVDGVASRGIETPY